MTCFKSNFAQAAPRHPPQGSELPSHQQATLLALHFRSASWTPCITAPALMAAAGILRVAEFPAAQWDVWWFPASAEDAHTHHTGKASLRRARLHAAASISAADAPDASWLMVVEERQAPGSSKLRRRYVMELASDPFAGAPARQAIDPRAIASLREMPAKDAGSANPPPDLTVDLEGLGLIAPRASTW